MPGKALTSRTSRLVNQKEMNKTLLVQLCFVPFLVLENLNKMLEVRSARHDETRLSIIVRRKGDDASCYLISCFCRMTRGEIFIMIYQ